MRLRTPASRQRTLCWTNAIAFLAGRGSGKHHGWRCFPGFVGSVRLCASLLQIKRWLHHLNGSASISEVLLATAINGKARGRGGPLEAVGSSGSSPPDEEEVDKELPQVVARLPLSIGFPIRFPVSCTRNRAFLDSRPGQQKDVETVKLFRPQKPSEVTVRA